MRRLHIILLLLALLTLASCGHEHTPAVDEAVAPTCTATGKTEGSHCSECGEVITAQEEIAKVEHIPVVDEAVAPTCTATGKTEGSHCSECGEVITAQEEIAKIEHTPVVDEAVAPTCTATGLTEGSHCSECGEVITAQEEVAKTEHTAVTDKAISATCKSTGKTEGSHCSVCNTVLVAQQTTNKTDHSYTITYDKTNHTKTCVYCQESIVEKHSLNSSNQCSCGYKEITLSATQDTVTKIAKSDISVFYEMTDLRIANGWLERDSYSYISGITSWGKTVNGNDTARVKEISFLNTSGFAMVIVDNAETTITKSYILLESNTTDPNHISHSIVFRTIESVNQLYGAMGNEVIVSLDTFLEALHDYSETDFGIYEKREYVSKGATNAIENFKQSIRDMNTYTTIKGKPSDPLYNDRSKLIITTENYKYTFTAQLYLDCKTQEDKVMRLTIEGERIS